MQELASIISASLADENSALEKPQLALASSAEIQVMSPKKKTIQETPIRNTIFNKIRSSYRASLLIYLTTVTHLIKNVTREQQLFEKRKYWKKTQVIVAAIFTTAP